MGHALDVASGRALLAWWPIPLQSLESQVAYGRFARELIAYGLLQHHSGSMASCHHVVDASEHDGQD